MYHLTLEMVHFYDSIKSTDFYNIQPYKRPSLGGKNVKMVLTPNCWKYTKCDLHQLKVKSKHHVPLSRFVLAIWCHLLTNENQPHHIPQGSYQPVLQHPHPRLCLNKPSYNPTNFSSNPDLAPKSLAAFHKFLNKQVLILDLSLK